MNEAKPDLGVAEHGIPRQGQPVVGEAAVGQPRESAGTAAQRVVHRSHAPLPRGVLQHGGPLATGTRIRRVLTRAVGARRARTGVHGVAPEAVRHTDGQAVEGSLVCDRVVGAGVGHIAVDRSGAVDVRPQNVGIQRSPEQHGPLAAERKLAPFVGQTDERLTPEHPAALPGRPRVGRKTRLEHEDRFQTAAHVLGAAQPPARRHAAGDARHAHDAGIRRTDVIDILDTGVVDAVKHHGRLRIGRNRRCHRSHRSQHRRPCNPLPLGAHFRYLLYLWVNHCHCFVENRYPHVCPKKLRKVRRRSHWRRSKSSPAPGASTRLHVCQGRTNPQRTDVRRPDLTCVGLPSVQSR